MMRKVAILFDLDHTLGVDQRLEEGVLSDIGKSHCGVTTSREELVGILQEFRSGRLSLNEMLLKAFRDWNCPCMSLRDFVNEYESESLARVKSLFIPMPGTKEMLAGLSAQGVALAILSNGWAKLQQAKASIIQFPGPVLTSDELGFWKPDPKAFELALEKLKLEKSTTLYVGDSPETDVAGAKGVGLQTIWARLEGQTYPSGIAQPDYTITSLLELPSIVARLEKEAAPR